jgi:hypothetical protein
MKDKNWLEIKTYPQELEVSGWDRDEQILVRLTDDVTQDIYLRPKQVRELSEFLISQLKQIENSNNMKTEDEASKRCCELLRKIYLTESEIKVGAFDDNFLIERYSDEWTWFMQGWKETKTDENNGAVLE